MKMGNACLDDGPDGWNLWIYYPEGTDIKDIHIGPVAVVPWEEWEKVKNLYDVTVAYNALWGPK